MSSQHEPSGRDQDAREDRVSRGAAAAREGQPNQDRAGHEDRGGRADGGDHLHRVSHGDRADRGARWNRGDQPYVDTQALGDRATAVYEAVATLEYSGRSVTRREVMEATQLDDATVSEVLDALTEQGVLSRTRADDGDAFELARRDWSATPDTRPH